MQIKFEKFRISSEKAYIKFMSAKEKEKIQKLEVYPLHSKR